MSTFRVNMYYVYVPYESDDLSLHGKYGAIM